MITIVPPKSFTRKPNRLPLANYAGTHAYLLTLVAAARRRPFNDQLVTFSLEKLRTVAGKHGAIVLAYCFMPDHVHLLLESYSPTFLTDFVRDFKQSTGYTYKQRTGQMLWQKSYHDRVLRRDDSVLVAAKYIAANPVRAGLVVHPRDFPFTGSFVWDKASLVEG